MGSHKRAIDAYMEAEKISLLPDWEIYHGLGKLLFVTRFITRYITLRATLAKLYKLADASTRKCYFIEEDVPWFTIDSAYK